MLLALLVLSAAAAWPLSSSAAAATAAASALISSYSFPVFNGTTTTTTDGDGLVVATNSSILSPATFLFDAQLFPEFNESDGFVLLSRTVDLWCATADVEGSTAGRREASFNTSFTVDVDGLSSSNTVAFVVLLDSFPPLNSKHGHRGGGNDSAAVSGSGIADPVNASNSFVAVEVGTVNSYGPRSRGVGLNVTVTPNRTSPTPGPSLAVRIEYDAVAHHLSVYLAAAGAGGEPWLPTARLLDAPLDLAGRVPTQTAFVGFFAATVRDVVDGGVRDWELTVDRFPDDDERRDDEPTKENTSSSSSWLVVPVAVAGSVAAVAAVAASVVVCISLSRRRALDVELKQCYSNYFARRRL